MKKILLLLVNTTFLVLACSLYTAAQIVNLAFEDAHSLGKGGFDITGMYSHQSSKYKGLSENMGDLFGGEVGVGVSKNVDLKFRYEALVAPSEWRGYNVNYYSIIPKFSLKKDVLSFMLPLSVYTSKGDGERSTGYSVAPRLLATLSAIPNKADVSFSAKGDFLIPQEGKTYGYLGLNLGAGFSNNLNRWAVRPEISYLIHPGDEGSIWTFGIGVQALLHK